MITLNAITQPTPGFYNLQFSAAVLLNPLVGEENEIVALSAAGQYWTPLDPYLQVNPSTVQYTGNNGETDLQFFTILGQPDSLTAADTFGPIPNVVSTIF